MKGDKFVMLCYSEFTATGLWMASYVERSSTCFRSFGMRALPHPRIERFFRLRKPQAIFSYAKRESIS